MLSTLNPALSLPGTSCLVSILHGPEEVPARLQHAQQLWQRVWVDLTGREPVRHEQHVIGLVVDGDGAKLVDVAVDVVLVDILFFSLQIFFIRMYKQLS